MHFGRNTIDRPEEMQSLDMTLQITECKIKIKKKIQGGVPLHLLAYSESYSPKADVMV